MSYGVNAPQGLQPRRYLNGATWTQQTNDYPILSGYGTSLFVGDPVTLLNNGTIGIGTAGNAIVGVFMGCRYQDINGNYVFSPYWPASTVTWNPGGTGNVNAAGVVADDPNILFDIQCSGTAAITGDVNTIKIGELNYNYNFHSAAGSTISGQSGYYLDLASQATTATLNLKLIKLTPAVNNSFGLTFNNGLVLINNHIYKGGTGTVGV